MNGAYWRPVIWGGKHIWGMSHKRCLLRGILCNSQDDGLRFFDNPPNNKSNIGTKQSDIYCYHTLVGGQMYLLWGKNVSSTTAKSWRTKSRSGFILRPPMLCPSFFWYDNDKDIKVCFLMTRANLIDDIGSDIEHCYKSLHLNLIDIHCKALHYYPGFNGMKIAQITCSNFPSGQHTGHYQLHSIGGTIIGGVHDYVRLCVPECWDHLLSEQNKCCGTV